MQINSYPGKTLEEKQAAMRANWVRIKKRKLRAQARKGTQARNESQKPSPAGRC